MKIGQRCCACIVAIACLAPSPLHAIDKFWIDPAGGPFGDTGNWDDSEIGLGGDPVPGVADIANFTLNNTYTVTFAAGVTNSDLDVASGNVTFDLDGFTYTLTNGSAVEVGNVAGQTGRLTVADGILAAGTGGFDMLLGTVAGSTGLLTVTTGGSLGTAALRPDLFIGQLGAGTLTVNDNGRVEARTVNAGNITGSTGTLSITGPDAVMDLSGATTIGNGGTGTLNVTSGAQVVSSSSATLGSNAGSEGRVTVTGAGSQWTLGSGLIVGNLGTGDLMVSAGGEVSTSLVTIGNSVTGSGVATVTGAGSKLRALGGGLGVGAGTLNVASGAEVYVGGELIVPGAVGTVNLDGGSIFVGTNFTNNGVFNFTDGLLQVQGSFQPSAAADSLVINGNDNGDLPTLDLIGTGPTGNVTSLVVGENRRGQLLLRQGRVLDVGVNSVNIGAAVGGEGTLSVESGAQLIGNSLVVGGGLSGAGGTGTLNISGGTVDVNAMSMFRDGTINLASGMLAVNTMPMLDGQFNWTGGTLRFDFPLSLTSTNVPKLLGLDATLNAGQALTSNAGIPVTLQTPVIVDGGSLNANSLINQSRLEVRSGTVSAVQNDGLLLGDGTITGAVSNNAAGKIRVDAGKTLYFSGAFAPNAGELNLQGGTLDFTGAITNSATGFIAGRGALYTGGLTNDGAMAFSGGNMDVHGDVNNAAGARIVTSGAGSVTTFFDDVTHNGLEIFTGVAGSTVFFGDQSGAGPFTGTGTVYYISDLRPGNSPANVNYGGDVVFSGAASLTLEIGGTTPGSEYDRLTIAGSASLDGTLDVSLINGFTPSGGQQFTILTAGTIVNNGFVLGGPAASSFTLLVNSTSVILQAISAALPGDYNLDATVDAADYVVWRKNDGTQPGYETWRANFGATAGSGSAGASPSHTAVPEPANVILAVAATIAMTLLGWRRR